MDLHCTICYNDFDVNERYPVVLPCGHTYVCKVCVDSFSPKLCHICREPLVIYPPRPQQSAVTNHAHGRNVTRSPVPARYSRYNSRYSPTTPPPTTTRPERVEPIPLPLPENTVLMDMIKAKQRQERLVAEQKEAKLKKKRERMREKKLTAQQSQEEEDKHSADSQYVEIDIKGNESLLDIAFDNEVEEVDSDDDLSASSSTWLPLGGPELISGYAALSGACGTYAVREPEGLVVLPLDPNRQKHYYTKDHDDEKKEGSQHSNAQFSSIFRNVDRENHSNNDGDKKPSARREPFSIAEGQQVQVVGVMESSDHSVYQLARNAGFIVASGKQLVKGTSLHSSFSTSRHKMIFFIVYSHVLIRSSCFDSWWSDGKLLQDGGDAQINFRKRASNGEKTEETQGSFRGSQTRYHFRARQARRSARHQRPYP